MEQQPYAPQQQQWAGAELTQGLTQEQYAAMTPEQQAAMWQHYEQLQQAQAQAAYYQQQQVTPSRI